MTLTDELKKSFKVNQAQINLDREAAKISALSSIGLDKCEYLTGELVKIWDINQVLLNKLNMNILHWVKL